WACRWGSPGVRSARRFRCFVRPRGQGEGKSGTRRGRLGRQFLKRHGPSSVTAPRSLACEIPVDRLIQFDQVGGFFGEVAVSASGLGDQGKRATSGGEGTL